MNLANYRTSIILAVTFTLLLSTFWFYQDFAFIIFLSLLLQLLLKPAVDFMEARRMPRSIASAIAIIAFILVLAALASIISRSVLPSFQRFVAELPTIGQSLQQLPFLSDTDFIQDEFVNILDRLRSVGAELLRASLSFLLVAFGKVIDFVIIIFVSFYLLKDGLTIKLWLTDLFPHTARRRVLRLFDTLLIALRAYICSQIVMCVITGVVVFAYFKLMGLPYASVFALLSGVSEFVPVLGPTVASTLGTLMTASAMRELTVQTALFYVALTQVNHNVVYPALVGKSLHLHPVAVILGVVFGGELLGAAGMFLAVPFIVIIKIVITDIYRDRREMQGAEEE
ncbi:PF01594 domain protein [Selenomonas sp. FOBRC6]|uniref:AI-2E family transporter n=1 Tax=Selenomonas sp. FOBRC6 TaxID=936572 RepID=UPI00027822E1|nr:AI-2E family transporter [Selenomonas sp. FOBRC6]EJO23409.1 PF01594 domain protein [Selenomonas sp. FOBRC6]